MNVCFATSECVPFVKTGGLADVSGALPKALAAQGCSVKVILPLYGSIQTLEHNLVFATELSDIPVQLGGNVFTFNTWYKQDEPSGVEYYFVDAPHFFHRPALYTWDSDEGDRFLMLQHAALKILQHYNWSPDVLHANDWQTALMPALIKEVYAWDSIFQPTASVFSIHNIGYQGRFNPFILEHSSLPIDKYYPTGPFELYGSFSFMKTGLVYADKLCTVSPTYAHEIKTKEYGEGLDGVLRDRASDLSGILNGIDMEEWNPSTDTLIPHTYSAGRLSGKYKNKQALMERFGLEGDKSTPVAGIVSRLTGQKGLDLLMPVLEDVIQHSALRFVVLGSGDRYLEDFFNWAATSFPGRVGVYLGYNNELAHLIEAGSDIFIMPSRYEPCGLNQMYSLAYGTLPIVRNTGGLADTVIDYHAHPDHGNGFSFNDFTTHALRDALYRSAHLFQDQATWVKIMKRGMKQDFSWERSAKAYISLYEEAISQNKALAE